MSKPKHNEPDPIMLRLAGTIRMLRDKQRLSYRELAEKVGCGSSDIFRLENASTGNPSVFLIQKVARYFGLTVDELMDFNAVPCPTCGGSGWVKNSEKEIIDESN